MGEHSAYKIKKPEQSGEFFENLVWLNSVDAAKYLRISVNALRIAVCRGEIKAHKFRGRLYFKRIEIDRMVLAS